MPLIWSVFSSYFPAWRKPCHTRRPVSARAGVQALEGAQVRSMMSLFTKLLSLTSDPATERWLSGLQNKITGFVMDWPWGVGGGFCFLASPPAPWCAIFLTWVLAISTKILHLSASTVPRSHLEGVHAVGRGIYQWFLLHDCDDFLSFSGN